MQTAPDQPFKTLADPTRRAIFGRLIRDGERTVRALTDRAGVSQPAVSKHLGVLKLAGLATRVDFLGASGMIPPKYRQHVQSSSKWPEQVRPGRLERQPKRQCSAVPLEPYQITF